MKPPPLTSVLTCPHCGHARREVVPTDHCLFFYVCERCQATLTPHPGDCCVFCSFGSVRCPSARAARPRAGEGAPDTRDSSADVPATPR